MKISYNYHSCLVCMRFALTAPISIRVYTEHTAALYPTCVGDGEGFSRIKHVVDFLTEARHFGPKRAFFSCNYKPIMNRNS